MLRHFLIPWVTAAYLSAIGLNFAGVLPHTWYWAAAQAVTLMVVDFLVHRRIHQRVNEEIEWPWRTAVWSAALALCAFCGMYSNGWQLALAFIGQGLWDNSWHSVEEHRPNGEPTTQTDYAVIRWGSMALALGAMLAPHVPSFFTGA